MKLLFEMVGEQFERVNQISSHVFALHLPFGSLVRHFIVWMCSVHIRHFNNFTSNSGDLSFTNGGSFPTEEPVQMKILPTSGAQLAGAVCTLRLASALRFSPGCVCVCVCDNRVVSKC